MNESPEMALFFLNDLANHGLISTGRQEIVHGMDAMQRLITELGKNFLLFIQEPNPSFE